MAKTSWLRSFIVVLLETAIKGLSSPHRPCSGWIDSDSPTNGTLRYTVAKEIFDGTRCESCESISPQLRQLDESCPIILTYLREDGGGLSHYLSSSYHVLHEAVGMDLTINYEFVTRGHNVGAGRVYTYFFGDYFRHSIPTNAETFVLNSSSTLESVTDLVREAQKNCTRNTTTRKAVHIDLTRVEFRGFRHSSYNVPILRNAFEAHLMKPGWEELTNKNMCPPSDCVHDGSSSTFYGIPSEPALKVAVHIRRGDLEKYVRKHSDAQRPGIIQSRLMRNEAILSLLRRLLSLPEVASMPAVRIVLHCEGSAGGMVTDIDGSVTNFSDELRNAFWAPRQQKPERTRAGQDSRLQISHGSQDPICAFHDMCFSDVLVTGLSGFSHMVAVLCRKPVVLAIQSWEKFDCVPNHVPVITTQTAPFSVPNLLTDHKKTRFASGLASKLDFNTTTFSNQFRLRGKLYIAPLGAPAVYQMAA